MCRLFGLIANQDVDVRFSLLGTRGDSRWIRELAPTNPDGWGIGWYEGSGPRVVKEPLPAHESEGFRRAVLAARSRVFVSHVREASEGAVRTENCHPFVYEGWIFAHNGTVSRERLLSKLSERHFSAIEGETDSEVLFHWVLQNIERAGDAVEGIRVALKEIVQPSHPATAANYLLTDGRTLYACRYAKRDYDEYSLYYLERKPSTSEMWRALSSDTGELLESKMSSGAQAVLVCSERLTDDEDWREIPCGHLLVVDSGLFVRIEPVKNLGESPDLTCEDRNLT
ncbi:MAG: class II glutamine amidotransferase [Thermoleophilia bacterium]|nr:class II glutamine amidotransferase [Thermoleophilia bacterium]